MNALLAALMPYDTHFYTTTNKNSAKILVQLIIKFKIDMNERRRVY